VIRLAREVADLKQESVETRRKGLLRGAGQGKSHAAWRARQPAEQQAAGSVKTDADAAFDLDEAQLKLEMESNNRTMAKVDKEKAAIAAQIKAYQGRLNLGPALEQEYSTLTRAYDALKQQYATLQNKKFQAQMSTNVETSKNNVTYNIVDEANLPEKPESPDPLEINLMGFVRRCFLESAWRLRESISIPLSPANMKRPRL